MKTALFLALCLPLAACSIHVDHDEQSGDIKKVNISIGHSRTEGNGLNQSEARPLALDAVRAVSTTGGLDVDIRIGSPASLKVEGDSNLLKLVETELDGDKLIIRQVRGYDSDNELRVHLVLPQLARLENTGSGEVSLAGLAAGDLAVRMTGSGETRLAGKLAQLDAELIGSGDLVATELMPSSVKVAVLGSGDAQLGKQVLSHLDADVKGSGSISASGTAGTLRAAVLGSGDVQLRDLQANDATVELLGSGDVAVYAVQSISATAKGSGDIVVYGKPPKQSLSGENARLAP